MRTFIQNFQYKAVTLLTAICAVTFFCISVVNINRANLGTSLIPNAKEGEIFLSSCEVHLDGDDRNYAGDCGTLIVRENRENPNSRLIPLPVRRIRALGKTPMEPIFWFEGGPGGPNSMSYPTDGILENHDFVMVGYRGIEGEVKLLCEEIGTAVSNLSENYLSNEALDSYADAAEECSKRYTSSGVDLSGYTMNHTIDDMEIARKALGYDRINLYGNSYGTRLELLYQWSYPDSLNRVVQVAVNPPGHFVFYPDAIEKQIRDYSNHCAADDYCSSRTSNLYQTIKTVLQELPPSWMGIKIDADTLRFITMVSFMESMETPGELFPLNGPAVVDMWLDAAEGDPSGLAIASLISSNFLPTLAERGHFLAMGASAPDFLDKSKDYRSDLRPQDTLLGSPFSLMIAAMIEGWAISNDQAAGVLQKSEVETLLINGSIDGSTPAQYGRDELLPFLSNGNIVVIKDQGHTETFWNSQPEARARLINTYFDYGVVDSSQYEYQPLVFEVQKSWSSLGYNILISAGVACVLLIGLISWGIRRIRRKNDV